ncbi:MAG: sensor histidine kinase [Rhizomicrobium sp.]
MNESQPDVEPSRSDSGAPGRTLFALLQKSDTPSRQRALLVLLVTVPVWTYVTTWDALMMQFLDVAYGQSIAAGDLAQMMLNNLLIFPLLLGAYYLATGIAFRPKAIPAFLGKQIVIGIAFSALTRPAKIVACDLTSPSFAAAHRGPGALFNFLFHYWPDWLAVTIQYSIVYLFGLVVLLGITAFLRYKSEQLRAEQMQSRWLATRLGMLRGQLDPHFFFNALNVIVSFVRSDPRRAEKLLTELSTLMRSSLTDFDRKFATVRSEMAFVERYLVIMKARYERRLDVTTTLDPQTLDCRIPTFLLVPLVENAIKHGVDRQPGRNIVEISSRRANGAITFVVKNSPSGNEAGYEAEGSGTGTGTGLSNTRERLSAIYGHRYTLESGPTRSGQWCQRVSLPAETDAMALA